MKDLNLIGNYENPKRERIKQFGIKHKNFTNSE